MHDGMHALRINNKLSGNFVSSLMFNDETMKTLIFVLALGGAHVASCAEEIGTTGMWINERRTPKEPLLTGMVWTNSPADKVGIKPGLFLIAVNGTNVVSKPTVEVLGMVRGPVGAIVTLHLADAALTKTNKFTIKRGRLVMSGKRVVDVTE